MAADTDRRLAQLERRLAYLEAKLASGSPRLPEPEAAKAPARQAAPTSAPFFIAPVKPRKGASDDAGPANPHASAVIGGSEVLAGVAVLCFILGASYLVKLAMDHGWLDPARRLILAACAGFGLIGAGFALRRKDAAYAAFLPATGSVVLYLAVYAGQLIYGLIDPLSALFLISAVTTLTLGLFKEFPVAAYPIVALLGCYAVPFFAPALEDHGWLLFYFLVWDLSFAAIAILAKQRDLLLVAGYLALAAFSLAAGLSGASHPIGDLDSAVFLFAQMLVFFTASVGFSIYHRQPMRSGEAWSVLPLLLFFYGLEYDLMSRLLPGQAAWAGLAWAGAVLGVYGGVRKQLERGGLEAGPMVSAYVSIIALHAAYLELLPAWAAPWVGLALIPLAASLLRTGFGKRHFVVVTALGVVIALEFFRSAFLWEGMQAGTAWPVDLAFSLLLLGSALYFGRQAPVADAEQREKLESFAFAAAHLQALLGLSRACEAWINVSGGFVSSVTFAAYGLAVMGVAWGLRHRILARSAVVVLLIAAAKAVLYDLAQAETGFRVVGFMSLGVFLYLAGWLMRQTSAWDEKGRA